MPIRQANFRNCVVEYHHNTKEDRLAFFRRELMEAKRMNDAEEIKFCQRAIREITRPPRKGPIDIPLFPLKRPKTRKSTKR